MSLDSSDDAIPAAGDAATLLTVTALNRAVARALRGAFPLVRVRGEVANFTSAASGHWYFSLKDEGAQVRCAMFRGRNALVGFTPRNGDAVEVLAEVALYEARGEFQLVLEAMRRAGVGRLFEEFNRLRLRLAAEGLFDAARKRALPRLPARIGVVTSLQAAALRDVVAALARRAPQIPLVVYPVPVQGAGAGERIAAMLATVARRREVDVVLLVRGGGSIEDLWAFNEEVVARAIRASSIPVVVGVGHESDVTIADFAADLRAPTPTAAAEMAAAPRDVLVGEIDEALAALRRALDARVRGAAQRIDYARRSLASPRHALAGLRDRVAQTGARFAQAHMAEQAARAARLEQLAWRLRAATANAGRQRERSESRLAALRAATRSAWAGRAQRLDALRTALVHLDPEAVLARGYAIVVDAQGRVIADAGRVREGEVVQARFARGAVDARVMAVRPHGASARADTGPAQGTDEPGR